MDFYQAIILGVIQGLTEFLPVSSSGHLVIAQSLIPGFSQPGVLFDVILHAGTLLAVVLYFRKRIISLDKRMFLFLMLGSIPAGFVGFLFKDFLEDLFSNPQAVGVALLATGVMNWAVDTVKRKTHKQSLPLRGNEKRIGWVDTVVVGVFQAIAIIPGISRSGSTIFAGVWQGIKKEDAAEFSFLLSIPAVGGAIFLQLLDYNGDSFNYIFYLSGAVTALVVGYASIGLLMKLLVQRYFKIFAVYCFIVGLTTLILTI